MSHTTRRLVWAGGLALAAWVLLAGTLMRTTGGLPGVYSFTDGSGREIEVTRRTDPQLDFPVPQRLDAAYIFNWDLQRFGFPADKPPYVIRWRGMLAVPQEGVYGFSIDAQGETGMSLDGAALEIRPDAVTERRLSAGLHAIEVEYRLQAGEARFVMSWQPPRRRLAAIPERFLGADAASFAARRARRFWGMVMLAAGIALPVLLAAGARRRPGGGAANAMEAVTAERGRLALGGILVLAALLRFHDYALVPFHHETADEYQHAWEGWHLLHERTPAAWSTFPDSYPIASTRDFRWFGDRYVLVRPYFDHPPLFSIPVGLLCSLMGARSFLDCTLPVMRLVPILCSLIGLVLLVRLARAWGASERAALLAALVYATMPVIILSHRLVKAEGLLSGLCLGALLALGPPETPPGRRSALWAGVLCGLAIWTKATGLAVVLTVVLILAARRRFRDAAVAAGVASGFLGLYLLYAWACDFGIFLKIMQAQATSKWVALDALPDLLGGKVVVKWFGRGAYLWLLLAAGVAAFRRERLLLLPVVLYGTLLAMTADHRVIYGWYRIPMLPFLCIAAGLYLESMLEEADLYRVFPFAASAVASGLLYALPDALADRRGLMLAFAAVVVLPFLPRIVKENRGTVALARAGAGVLLALFLASSVLTVGRMLEVYSAARGIP